MPNLCIEAGCRSDPSKKQYPSCCHDITIYNIGITEIREYFPGAKYFTGLSARPTSDGSHFTERNFLDDGKGPYTLYIVGPCENLDRPTGNCKHPVHPWACINAKRCGAVCIAHRMKDGLPAPDTIFKES